MQYTVMVRKHTTGRYTAVAPAIPGCSGKGKNRTEALSQLQNAIQSWLQETEITTIDVPMPAKNGNPGNNPWLATAGIFADDPTLDQMLEDIYAARDAERLVE